MSILKSSLANRGPLHDPQPSLGPIREPQPSLGPIRDPKHSQEETVTSIPARLQEDMQQHHQAAFPKQRRRSSHVRPEGVDGRRSRKTSSIVNPQAAAGDGGPIRRRSGMGQMDAPSLAELQASAAQQQGGPGLQGGAGPADELADRLRKISTTSSGRSRRRKKSRQVRATAGSECGQEGVQTLVSSWHNLKKIIWMKFFFKFYYIAKIFLYKPW